MVVAGAPLSVWAGLTRVRTAAPAESVLTGGTLVVLTDRTDPVHLRDAVSRDVLALCARRALDTRCLARHADELAVWACVARARAADWRNRAGGTLNLRPAACWRIVARVGCNAAVCTREAESGRVRASTTRKRRGRSNRAIRTSYTRLASSCSSCVLIEARLAERALRRARYCRDAPHWTRDLLDAARWGIVARACFRAPVGGCQIGCI